MNPFRNAARKTAIQETKMAQAVEDQAYRANVNAALIWVVAALGLLAVTITYKPSEPQQKERTIEVKTDTIQRHQCTPACVYSPASKCPKYQKKIGQ